MEAVEIIVNLFASKRMGKADCVQLLSAIMAGTANSAPILLPEGPVKGPEEAPTVKEGAPKGKEKEAGKGKAGPVLDRIETILASRFNKHYDPAMFLASHRPSGKKINKSNGYAPKRLGESVSKLLGTGEKIRFLAFAGEGIKCISRVYANGKRLHRA